MNKVHSQGQRNIEISQIVRQTSKYLNIKSNDMNIDKDQQTNNENERITDYFFKNSMLEADQQLIKQSQKKDEYMSIRQDMKSRQIKHKWIVFPDDQFKMLWDFFVIFSLIYTCIITPYIVAFIHDLQKFKTLYVIDNIIDVIFSIDIIINFFSAYYDQNDDIVIDKRKIAIKYIKSWFIIDFLGVFPIYLFIEGDSKSINNLVRLLRIQRLYKLLRLNRLKKIVISMARLSERSRIMKFIVSMFELGPQFQRLVISILGLVLFCHFFACMWYFQATLYPYKSWVVIKKYENRANFDIYIASFYWVTQTIVTVGYGDMSCGNALEKSIACLLMFIGVFFYSFTIGILSSLLTSIDESNTNYKLKLNALIALKKQYNISDGLYSKIKSNLKNDKNYEVENLLDDLPNDLSDQFKSYMYLEKVENIYFFRDHRESGILSAIGPLPQYDYLEVRSINVNQGEYIYKENKFSNDMFFIKKGMVSINDTSIIDGQVVKLMTIQQGNYFGASEIFLKQSRTFSAKAESECVLLIFNRKYFKSIFLKRFRMIGQSVIDNSLRQFKIMVDYQNKAIDIWNSILDKIDHELDDDKFIKEFDTQFDLFNQNSIDDIKDTSIYENPKNRIKKNKDVFKANFQEIEQTFQNIFDLYHNLEISKEMKKLEFQNKVRTQRENLTVLQRNVLKFNDGCRDDNDSHRDDDNESK